MDLVARRYWNHDKQMAACSPAISRHRRLPSATKRRSWRFDCGFSTRLLKHEDGRIDGNEPHAERFANGDARTGGWCRVRCMLYRNII